MEQKDVDILVRIIKDDGSCWSLNNCTGCPLQNKSCRSKDDTLSLAKEMLLEINPSLLFELML